MILFLLYLDLSFDVFACFYVLQILYLDLSFDMFACFYVLQTKSRKKIRPFHVIA